MTMAWDADRLRCTAWIRDESTGRILQSVTHVIPGMTIVTDVAAPRSASPPVIASISPNPCNPSTRILFTMPAQGPVRVEIHDLGGRRVRTLLDDVRAAGAHAVTWDGHDDDDRCAGSGAYLCRISTPGGVAARRITLLR